MAKDRMIRPTRSAVPVDCTTPFVLPMLTIDDGNIQVKP
jgi:hypothetical protein